MASAATVVETGDFDATGRRWIIVVLLAIVCIVAYVDRVNLSIALIDEDFKDFFELSDSDRGFANSAFFWSYAVLQIPAGWLVDRFGSKRPMAFSLAVWSLLTAATSLATGFSWLFAIRLLLGVAEAGMHPASMRWIRFNFSEKQRGLAVGLFMSGSKFGPAIGAAASAWLIEGFGWKVMFVLLGLGSLCLLVPWLLLVKNDGSADVGRQLHADTVKIPFSSLVASPVIWGTVIGTFSYMYFVYFCLTWMPAYFKDSRNLSLNSSSLYTTFSFAGMAVVSIVAGWAADRLICRGYDPVTIRKTFTIAGFTMASTELLGSLAPSLSTALFFSVFSLSGLGLATANYWALTQTLIPSGSIGKIVGIQNCAASGAGIVAPILTGWLVERTGSYTAPMQAVLFFLLMGIASYLLLVRRRYAPTVPDASFRPATT